MFQKEMEVAQLITYKSTYWYELMKSNIKYPEKSFHSTKTQYNCIKSKKIRTCPQMMISSTFDIR